MTAWETNLCIDICRRRRNRALVVLLITIDVGMVLFAIWPGPRFPYGLLFVFLVLCVAFMASVLIAVSTITDLQALRRIRRYYETDH